MMVNDFKLKAGFLIYTLVSCIYFGIGPLTLIIDTVALVVSVFALYIMYMFFKTRPHVHQTVIIGLMKMLVFFYLIGVIKYYIFHTLLNVFLDSVKALFEEHPTLVCSLFSSRWIVIGALTTLSLITLTKTFLILFPHKFLNLQHEKWTLVCVGLTLIVVVMDIGIHTGLNGHYCNINFAVRLADEIGVTKIPTFQSVPWLQIIILIVGESISFLVPRYRAWQQRVEVVPVQIPIAVIVPSARNPVPVAQGGWVGNQQENINTSEKKLSRNITLLMGSLFIVSSLMTINASTSENVDLRFILLQIEMFILRFHINVLPLAWILSTDETLEFASKKCKEILILDFWPQAIRDYFSADL